MGTVRYVGKLSMLEAFPLIALAKIQISAVVSASLPDLYARLIVAGKLLAGFTVRPPQISAALALALQTLANLQVGITPPMIDFAGMACLQLIAKLQIILPILDAALAWGIYPGSAHLFVYEGRTSELGATVAAYVKSGMLMGMPPNATVFAPFLVVDTTDAVSLPSIKILVMTP